MAAFHWRARRLAWRTGDAFSLISATRPQDLAMLLRLARGRLHVVELGTATAWTAISLALADPRREVTSYDPAVFNERERYLALVPPAVRARLDLVEAPGQTGARASQSHRPDFLYIDSSHAREDTLSELRAWLPALKPGAIVALDDYTSAAYPGVREAVQELALAGYQRGAMFVHEVGASER